MKIKVKLNTVQYECELEIMESYCNIPFISNKELQFYVKYAGLQITPNILNQLSEEAKNQIYKYIGVMDIVWFDIVKVYITHITAYSIEIGFSENMQIMEEIYSDFDSNIPINEFQTGILFPNLPARFLFQTLGDIYVEFDTNDLNILDFKIHDNIKKLMCSKGLDDKFKKYNLKNNI